MAGNFRAGLHRKRQNVSGTSGNHSERFSAAAVAVLAGSRLTSPLFIGLKTGSVAFGDEELSCPQIILQVIDIPAIPKGYNPRSTRGPFETHTSKRFCRIDDIFLRDVASSNPGSNPNN